MSVARRKSHANVAALKVSTGFESQLGLYLVGVRVAAVDDVVDGARVTALRHEHLGRVVKLGVLFYCRMSAVRQIVAF